MEKLKAVHITDDGETIAGSLKAVLKQKPITAAEYQRQHGRLVIERSRSVVALDPGLHTGLVTYHAGEYVSISTTTFVRAVEYLRTLKDLPADEKPLIVIEDPNSIGTLYARHRKGTPEAQNKMAQNVGMNKAHARELMNFCELFGLEVRGVKPYFRGKTPSETKANFFRKTGRTAPTEHAAIAGLLIEDHLKPV